MILSNSEHSIVFLPADVPHYYEAITEDIWDVRWFVPYGDGTLALLKEFGFDRCRIFPITNLGALDEIHNKIHMAFQINTKESIFSPLPILMNLYLNFTANTRSIPPRNRHSTAAG